MAWIRENYDRFLLALAALVLLGCAGLLLNNARGFSEAFNDLRGSVKRNDQIPAVDLERFGAESRKIAEPDTWKPVLVENRPLPLFVSVPYLANPVTGLDGTTKEDLIDPLTDPRPLHPPIPNAWFFDHKLDLLSQSALTDDPDGDGFSNLDEFNGKTDPANKESHPPYTSKLFLERFIQKPFRLRFEARNGQVVQINTLDIPDAPSQFLRVGQPVQGTKFKVVDLKVQESVEDRIRRDTSVVTLENTDTKERIDLQKEKDVDSPDSYALLTFVWGQGARFQLRKNQEFSLKPEESVKYRLVDVNSTGATLLRLADNVSIKVPPLPPPTGR